MTSPEQRLFAAFREFKDRHSHAAARVVLEDFGYTAVSHVEERDIEAVIKAFQKAPRVNGARQAAGLARLAEQLHARPKAWDKALTFESIAEQAYANFNNPPKRQGDS
jgi:hypothetical protein